MGNENLLMNTRFSFRKLAQQCNTSQLPLPVDGGIDLMNLKKPAKFIERMVVHLKIESLE
jgi:hypothetical protein